MNVVNFNNRFVEALNAKGIFHPALRDEWMRAPLFDVTLPEHVASELSKEHLTKWASDEKDEAMIPEIFSEPWPFPFIRASLNVQPESAEPDDRPKWVGEILAMRGVNIIASQANGHIMFLFHAKDDGKNAGIFMFRFHEDGLTSHGIYMSRRKEWRSFDEFVEAVREPNETDEHVRRLLATVIATVIMLWSAFLASVMSPQNHIASVTPNKEGKSVLWRHARTHYTIITHGHPANRVDVRHGQRVQSDEAGEIVRMAHNRRAHYRTLRSERFRYARGKRIFVRAAWIGPKEWQDEGGRQIYHILDPIVDMKGES